MMPPFVSGAAVAAGPFIGLLPIVLLIVSFTFGLDFCWRSFRQPLWLIPGAPMVVFPVVCIAPFFDDLAPILVLTVASIGVILFVRTK